MSGEEEEDMDDSPDLTAGPAFRSVACGPNYTVLVDSK